MIQDLGARLVFLVIVSLVGNPILAGEFTPPGLYEIEYYQLPNQMRVLLKERHQARSVSYRLVVNIGTADFPCGRQETTHFLEHLLFTGTSKHDESELDDLIEGHGGYWNAGAAIDKTYYELDIFSKYAELGLETLHEIIIDTDITQDKVDTSRDIIHREAGGRPTFFKNWYSSMGLGITGTWAAHDELLRGTPYVCQSLESADEIDRSDIVDAYQRYYVASNMTLIVVGDFESHKMKNDIESTFGKMKAGERFQRKTITTIPVENETLFTSTLVPFVGSEAEGGVVYATSGYQSANVYTEWFISHYLSNKLYNKLRVEKGLSYGPSVQFMGYPKTDILYLNADTDLDTIDEVIRLIQNEIDLLVQQPIDKEQLSLVKDKLLMSIVQGYESNSEIADYYRYSLFELEEFGALIRGEDKINDLTTMEIQQVAVDIFGKAPAIIYHDKSTMTYTQLATGLGLLGFILVGFVVRRVIRYRQQHN